MKTENNLVRSISFLALATGFLLLIPLIAMQFSDDVTWTLSDFIFAGTLLIGTGLTYILVTQIFAPRMGNNIFCRVAVSIALFTGFFLIWTNLAVGIIGSEDNPINVLYFGVIAVGIIGAYIARFRSQGMVFTMFAMALTQALIAAIVLAGGFYQSPPSTIFHILGVNGFFITLFVAAGMLFQYAGQEQIPAYPDAENINGD